MKPLSERMKGAADNMHAGMGFNENNLAAFAEEVAELETANMHAQLTIDELRAKLDETKTIMRMLYSTMDQLIVDKAELKKRFEMQQLINDIAKGKIAELEVELENAMAERGY